MNSKIMYGIIHPKKGLIGFSKGLVSYPNEEKPKEINLINTSLQYDKDIQLTRLKESPFLKIQDCKVIPVIIFYEIGETIENES